MGDAMPWTPVKFSVEQFQKMGEAGILREDERIELIDGELVRMRPIGSRHAYAVDALTRTLCIRLQDLAWLSTQNPVILGAYSEPQPDLKVLRLKPGGYARALPEQDDVLLVIEVSDSTLRYDREMKLPLYARHGIAEAWIVNLESGLLEVYLDPGRGGYALRRDVPPAVFVSPVAFPELRIDWGGALG